MSYTRATYRANHSDLRAIARFEPTIGKREKKLLGACKDRNFWHGDKYSKPENLGARMALKTLEDGLRIIDCMELQLGCMGEKLGAENSGAAKAFCHIRMNSYRAYRAGRLPQ